MESDPASDGLAVGSIPGENGGTDPRIRRTRRALLDATEALVEEGAPITMSAIAHRAGVSRQALHSHYDSVEQLAREVLIRRLLRAVGREAPIEREAAVRALVDAVRHEGVAPFLQAIHDDRDVFSALRSLGHERTTAVLAHVFADLVGAVADETGSASRQRAATLFIVGGMTASIDAWVRAEAPLRAAEQAALLDSFARAVFASDGREDRRGPER